MFKTLKTRHLALVAFNTFTVVSLASWSRLRISSPAKENPWPWYSHPGSLSFPGHPSLFYFSPSLHIQDISCKCNICLLMSDFFHCFHPKYWHLKSDFIFAFILLSPQFTNGTWFPYNSTRPSVIFRRGKCLEMRQGSLNRRSNKEQTYFHNDL